MDTTIIAALVGAVIGSAASLIGTWLQSYLGHGHARENALIDARRATYSRLLSAGMSEDSYPPDFMPSGRYDANVQQEVDTYNEKVRGWRKGRQQLKAIATEALLLAESEALKERLKEFIQSNNPNKRLTGIESLMREELRIL